MGSDLHVPQEGHRWSLPPPIPETVLGLWSPFLVLGQNWVETTSRKHLAPGLGEQFPGSDTHLFPCPVSVSVRRILGFSAGQFGFIHPT